MRRIAVVTTSLTTVAALSRELRALGMMVILYNGLEDRKTPEHLAMSPPRLEGDLTRPCHVGASLGATVTMW